MTTIQAQVLENQTGARIAVLGPVAPGAPVDERFEIRTEIIGGFSQQVLYLKDGHSLDFEAEPELTVQFRIGEFIFSTKVEIDVLDATDMTLRGPYQPTSFVPDSGNANSQTAVAALLDGGYIVVWTSKAGGVYAQRFNADGTSEGAEIAVSTSTVFALNPSVAVLESGDLVITWEEDTNARDVFARQFTSDGAPTGETVTLSFEPNERQFDPKVTALEAGGYVVTWVSDHEAPGTFNIFTARYDASGMRLDGTESQVSFGSGRRPDIAALADGGYVITWEGTGGAIYARGYSDAGQPVTSATELVGANGYEPSVVGLADGSYIVAWLANTSVKAQIIGPDGTLIGAELTLFERITDDRVFSGSTVSVEALPDGGFVAIIRAGDGDFLVRYFDADGAALGAAQAVGTAGFAEDNPAITVLLDGSVVISDGTITSIVITRIGVTENAAGATVGTLTAIDETDTGVTYTVDDTRFEVVSGQLKLKDGISLDYEAEAELSVTVTALETDGDTYSETFFIPVLDDGRTAELELALVEIWEDSSSDGIGNERSNNGVLVSDDQLELVAERVLSGNETAASPMEARYQAAIQAETGFSNPPTEAEVQAIIDAENADLSYLFAGSEEFIFLQNYPDSDWYVNHDYNYFNESYVADWDVSGVTNMSHMFYFAPNFDQDITSWNVSGATDMSYMFYEALSFNQDIGGWDTSSVTDMSYMFSYEGNNEAVVFDQNLGDWDISSLVDATGMLNGSAMSVANFDALLAGWATLDATTGETAIQSGVTLGAFGLSYTDATSKNHLEQVYGWSVSGELVTSHQLVVGSNESDYFLNNGRRGSSEYHGLGGNDTISGEYGDDTIVGGEGDDVLTGGDGADTFVYKFSNAGADTIIDFVVGEDAIDLSQLIVGFEAGVSDLADWVTLSANADGNTLVTIDHNGDGLGPQVTIDLDHVTFSTLDADAFLLDLII